MMTPEEQCKLIQPGSEVIKTDIIDRWLLRVQKLDSGTMVTAEIIRACIMRGSMALSVVHSSWVLNLTAQGLDELREANEES